MQGTQSTLDRLDALWRRPLDELEYAGLDAVRQLSEPSDLMALHVRGMCRFWQRQPELLFEGFDRVIQSLAIEGATFGLRLTGCACGIRIELIIDTELGESLATVCRALMPGMEMQAEQARLTPAERLAFGGLITGWPSMPKGDGSQRPATSGMDQIIRGMAGRPFALLFLATRLPAQMVPLLHTALFKEQAELSCRLTESLNVQQTGAMRTIQMTHYDVRHSLELLERYDAALAGAMTAGLWRVAGCYAARCEHDAENLRGLIKATYGDAMDGAFEPVRCIPVDGGVEQLLTGPAACCDQLPAMQQASTALSQLLANVGQYPLQTVMNGQALAELTRLPAQEAPGYYIDPYVEFDSAARVRPVRPLYIGDITQPGGGPPLYKNPYAIECDDLCRHALVVGITGSGKTNTMKSLLGELWIRHKVPFWVIESAKREYWQLLRTVDVDGNIMFPGLRLFTLGEPDDEKSIPYQINPFEVTGGASLRAHIESLLATFKASFELYPPMPYVLEAAVYEVYEDRGWAIDRQVNLLGRSAYPTLTDLYEKIDEVTDRMGYEAELGNNIKAALKARINSLRIGGKGLMMDVRAGVPIADLLNGPVVLELDGLGDDETKAFVIGILLVQLYEYVKEKRADARGTLLHALVIEEAHRLLKRVDGVTEGAGTLANSVNYFCNLLAEIRSYGEGILISDQIPTKLAPDALKNTNLKLIHRTVMKEDREAVGHAMNMTDDQIGYLSALRRGTAAVYAEGDSRPKLVRLPLVVERPDLPRHVALRRCKSEMAADVRYWPAGHSTCEACRYCERPCMFGAVTPAVLARIDINCYLQNLLRLGVTTGHAAELVECVLQDAHLSADTEVRLCILGHILERLDMDPAARRKLIRDYIRLYADRLAEGVKVS